MICLIYYLPFRVLNFTIEIKQLLKIYTKIET